MKVGEKGKQLFRQWEGLSTKVYNDSGGRPTIGIGHLLTKQELTTGTLIIDGVSINIDYHDLTEEQCWALLAQDLRVAERSVNELVKVPLNQNQFDALVSFVFNVGRSAFRDSTLLKFLNNGNFASVPMQLKRWNKVNGNVVDGLVNRRQKEVDLWLEYPNT